MSDSKPTFLLLRSRLPLQNAHNLIGRFVTHPSRPLDNSAPKDPSPIIDSEVVEVTELATSTVISSLRNSHVQATLEGLLSLNKSFHNNTSRRLEAKYIKTYRLTDHYKAFDKLEANALVREELDGPKGLFTRSKGKLYMIIGYKTCAPLSTFTAQSQAGFDVGAKITAPLSAIAGGMPLINVADPSIGFGVARERASKTKFVVEGEEVFAVEYKVVKRRNIFGMHSANTEPVIAHDPMVHDFRNAMYDDALKFSDEVRGKFDDDDDDDDDEDVVEEVPANFEEHILELLEDQLEEEDVIGEEQLILL